MIATIQPLEAPQGAEFDSPGPEVDSTGPEGGQLDSPGQRPGNGMVPNLWPRPNGPQHPGGE